MSALAPSPLALRAAAELELRKRREAERLKAYQYDPVGYIRDKLGWEPWEGSGEDSPGQVEVLEAYTLCLRQQHERNRFEAGEITEDELQYWKPGQVIQNRIRVEAGHTVGKTKLGSGVVNHFFDCFPPALIYTFAPSWVQIHDLLWKEIKFDRRGKGLPGRILDLKLEIGDNHFATGRAASDAGGKGTERVQGQHGPYWVYLLDESEGIADFVFNAVDSMASGGVGVVFMFANPRTRSSRFHKAKSLQTVKSFRISCINHPNVQQGREVVPGAVRRDYVLTMVEAHCEPVSEHDPDNNTFALGFSAVKNGITYPAGTIWLPDPEFCFRVLGIAPANLADKTFCPVGRYEAATNREPQEDRPHFGSIGVDVARFGKDFGTVYNRWNGRAWRSAFLAQQETGEYVREVKKAAREMHARGVTHLSIRVDGGGGFGGGVIDRLRTDVELIELFGEWKPGAAMGDNPAPGFRVHEVHNNGTPKDPKAYHNLGTEMYAETAEAVKSLAILNPPGALEDDLCDRRFRWVNKQGIDVRSLESKDDFRKPERHGRSPDDGDGFVLAVAPEHLFGDPPPYASTPVKTVLPAGLISQQQQPNLPGYDPSGRFIPPSRPVPGRSPFRR